MSRSFAREQFGSYGDTSWMDKEYYGPGKSNTRNLNCNLQKKA